MNHPRLFHRVWLGPNRPDRDCRRFGARLAELHPEWTVVEWNDDLAARLPLVLRDEFDAAPTYVHRADILLVEVVYRFGGVGWGYDLEPVRNLEPLIGDSGGWCTPDADGFPGGALFGAAPGHHALARILNEIRRRVWASWQAPHLTTGPHAWEAAIGPLPDCPLDVLGTVRTAYPIHYTRRDDARDPHVLAALHADPDVYAIHRFAGSWLGNPETIQVRR